MGPPYIVQTRFCYLRPSWWVLVNIDGLGHGRFRHGSIYVHAENENISSLLLATFEQD